MHIKWYFSKMSFFHQNWGFAKNQKIFNIQKVGKFEEKVFLGENAFIFLKGIFNKFYSNRRKFGSKKLISLIWTPRRKQQNVSSSTLLSQKEYFYVITIALNDVTLQYVRKGCFSRERNCASTAFRRDVKVWMVIIYSDVRWEWGLGTITVLSE